MFELNVICVAIVGFQVVYCCQQKTVQYTKVRKTNNLLYYIASLYFQVLLHFLLCRIYSDVVCQRVGQI